MKACACSANRPSAAVGHTRKIIVAHQFNNEPLRLLLAALGAGMNATDAFLSTTLQKHMLREIRTGETALEGGRDFLRWNPPSRRWVSVSGGVTKDEEDDDDAGIVLSAKEGPEEGFLPTKHNPVGFAVYGQMCSAGKSFQSAICE
jgi:general transcription factor 3C polypeptide 3 (transcription factor C subunit 4)